MIINDVTFANRNHLKPSQEEGNEQMRDTLKILDYESTFIRGMLKPIPRAKKRNQSNDSPDDAI